MLSFSLCHSAKCSVCAFSTAELCELTATRVSVVFENYPVRNSTYCLIASVLLALEVHAYFWNRSQWLKHFIHWFIYFYNLVCTEYLAKWLEYWKMCALTHAHTHTHRFFTNKRPQFGVDDDRKTDRILDEQSDHELVGGTSWGWGRGRIKEETSRTLDVKPEN